MGSYLIANVAARRHPSDWLDELSLIKDDEEPMWLFYIQHAFYFFLEFLVRPVGLVLTAGFVIFLVWQFRRVALRPLSPGEKLLRRTGLVLLALAYMGVPLAAHAWKNGWLTTWIFALPPAVLLIAALCMLLIPVKRTAPPSTPESV